MTNSTFSSTNSASAAAQMPFFMGASVATTAAMETTNLHSLWTKVRQDEALRSEVERLRKVKAMDNDAYTKLKVRLPYFCCGEFRGALRKSEHFVQIMAFVLDVDHFSAEADKIEALKARLAADERVAMCFRSPGGDGVKILFLLSAPCFDTKLFSDAYKAFAFRFAEQYDLASFMDFRTADATRVCFLSADETAYLNAAATTVNWEAYLPSLQQAQPFMGFSIPFIDEDMPMTGEATKAAAKPAATEQPENRSHSIQADVYAEILQKLQTKARPAPKRDVAQPDRLQYAVAPLTEAFVAQGMVVTDVKDIQYGKQFKLTMGKDSAELNVFYGKRGFSVVEVIRNAHNASLGQLCKFLAEQTILLSD